MILESLINLTVKHQGKSIVWPKGERLEWSEEVASKLLTQAPEKVRRIIPTDPISSFRSPIFGLYTGRLVFIEGNTAIVEDHSVLQTTVSIPRTWLVE